MDLKLRIDQKTVHKDVFLSYIRLMSKHLKKDICDLKLPGILTSEVERTVIERCVPPEVQYACRYWIDHLMRSDVTFYDIGEVHLFLQEHLLHWFEALSQLGRMSDGVLMVIALESIMAVSTT
jgi:hypothetical protein